MVRTAGSKSFTAGETSLLLDIVEKIRPLGRQKWDVVAAAYNDQISGKDWCTRDAEALKRRFMVLAYAKKPSEEWREFMDRAGILHQSILDEAGASPGGPLGILRSANGGGESEGMLLLTENEAELVHAASNTPVAGFDVGDDYLPRLSTASASSASALTLSTPMRTGKRGRPPGSTTGSAAKRLAQQAQEVRQLVQFVHEMQKQLREMREALATVVETQSNHAAVLAVLQQQLQMHTHQSSMPRTESNPSRTTTLSKQHSQQSARFSDENKPVNA